MPIYEYKCKKCSFQFEELVSSGTAESVSCPECKSKDTERIMSTFSGRTSVSGDNLSPSTAGQGCGGFGFS